MPKRDTFDDISDDYIEEPERPQEIVPYEQAEPMPSEMANIIGNDGVIDLTDVKRFLNMPVEHVKKDMLVDETFTVLGVAKFPTSKHKSGYGIIATIQRQHIDGKSTIVLDGQLLRPFLEGYFQYANMPPLRVTLKFNPGGTNDGYYYFG